MPTSEPGLPPPENRQFFPALDGLRALAVLLIFFHHYRLQRHGWLTWGWVAVDFFFVLSGFLITGILYDTRHTANRFYTFYARRTLRIFPLFYGVLLACLLATPLLHLVWTHAFLLWPFYLGNYTHLLPPAAHSPNTIDWLRFTFHPRLFGDFLSFGHLWSLCVEEQFYLVWPLLVYFIADLGKLLRICLGVILLLPFLRLAALLFAPPSWIQGELLYRATPFRCDALLLGAACALLWRTPHRHWLQNKRLLLLTAAACLLVCALFQHVLPGSPEVSALPTSPWIAVLGFTLVDLISACLLLLSLPSGTLLYRFLTIPALLALGRISYGFYVFHDIFHTGYDHLAAFVLFKLHLNLHHAGVAGIVLAFTSTLLLSILSYRFFETPFLRLKRFAVPKPQTR